MTPESIYYNNICFFWWTMKRLVGFGAFCFAMGMLVMLVIHNRFIGLLLIIALLLLGYFIFCSGD